MTFKERCIALRQQDYTLTEIAKITGRPKTSVYAHIHDMPLSAEKKLALQITQGERIKKYALLRRGISARKFRNFTSWNANSVFLISHFLFDGDIHRGACSYNNRNSPLIQRVERAMKTMYRYPARNYYNRTTGVFRISYFNVALCDYFTGKRVELLNNIFILPKGLKRVFLQAFFDDEGCMDFRTKSNIRKIRGYQKDVTILEKVQRLLLDFDITSTILPPNEIKIVGQNNLRKFQKEIGFSPGVRINGKRSNSIWRRSLEKRILLQRAISSYKPMGSNGVHRGTETLINL